MGKATEGPAVCMWTRCELVREEPPAWAQGAGALRNAGDVVRWAGQALSSQPQEVFLAALLSTQHRPIGVVEVSRGLLDASLVHPREVFRAAIIANAAALILIHQHPSGLPVPSPEDRAVSRWLCEAAETVGIGVLDSVIVGHGADYYSFADRGELSPTTHTTEG